MSDGVHLLTGHQETNHITAIDESTATAAFFSNENSVITDDDSVDAIPLTVNTTTGAVTIGSFVALFSGRKVTVSTATATYTRPASSSLYRRVSLGILYTKDTDNDDVEDCTFAAYTSATDTTEADAADDDTGAPTVTTIGSSTTTAYMELFDLVVSSDTVIRKSKTYNRTQTLAEIAEFETETANSITGLSSRINDAESAQTAETTARQNADASLGNRVTALENWKNDAYESLYKLVRIQFSPKPGIGWSTHYDVVRCGETNYGVIANSSNEAIAYSVSVSADGSTVTASSNNNTVYADIIGNVRIAY